MIYIYITGENITVSGIKRLLKKSVGQYEATIRFDESWSDYGRYVIFSVGQNKKDIRITSLEEVIDIPSELLENVGYMSISAVGIKDEAYRNTNIFRSIPIVSGSSVDNLSKPYTLLSKIDDYLWEIEYSNLDYDIAASYLVDKHYPVGGACSAVRLGNFILGTFDWYYNDQSSFVVRITSRNIGNRMIGLAGGVPWLTDDFVESKKYSFMYNILPFLLNSGVNEYGLYAKTNVVPMEKNSTKSEPISDMFEETSSLSLVYYILSNFKTAREAVEYVRDHLYVYFPTNLAEIGYQQHFIVCDKDESFVIEFVDDHAVIVESQKYITNFHIHGTIFNENGTVYTPETQESDKNAETFNHITPHGSGLERYNLIVNEYSGLAGVDSLKDLVNKLKYSNAYFGSKTEANPKWYSEFVNDELTVGSPVDHFEDVYERAGKLFLKRDREYPTTWHTVHAGIYDLDKLSVIVYSQENDVSNTFNLSKRGVDE